MCLKRKKALVCPISNSDFRLWGFFLNFFCVMLASALYSAGNLGSKDISVITIGFCHKNIQEIVSK